MSKWLTILEVSQKQAYIFASKKLQDNIVNSAIISHVLSPDYLSETLNDLGYITDSNLVYSGGGHTILQSDDNLFAKQIVSRLTETVYRDFDGLMIYAKTIEYDETKSPKENLVNLTKQLEAKKAIRACSFKQGSYGIEEIDSDTLSPKVIGTSEQIDKIKEEPRDDVPKEFEAVTAFEKLGGTKYDSNFIAIVHIDGNGMGKRVDELYSDMDMDWDNVCKKLRSFSDSIDADFKRAYTDMTNIVAENMKAGKIDISLKNNNFPVRRIIAAGDDICFVTEGRIGIECARIFIECLSNKKNEVDDKNYSACAGVAIVHQKYPFYRAYELAERLCSKAKKYGASIEGTNNGRDISSIDWHIAFGEIQNSIEEIRRDYLAADGSCLNVRPYIVVAPTDVMQNESLNSKKYASFRKVMLHVLNNMQLYGVGKVKGLRMAMKSGVTAKKNYLKFNRIEDITNDYEDTLFDVIELIDTFIPLEGSVR
ncbi:MAG: hypothetical protein NC428_05635 [Clostridium sp.]|nr:hypothetical protein [Clostridium sp.]